MRMLRFGRRRSTLPATIGPDLQAELDSGLGFMYPWRLTDAVTAPLIGPTLPSVHNTRAELIEPAVRAALEAADPDARAIDIGCHEGWFAHRLLEWGAREVIGIDVREVNIRRAELIRDHLGVPADRLRFAQASVYDLESEGKFDVVLMLGLIYHLENPIGAIRVARKLTRRVCAIESQLTRQTTPIRTGWGIPGEYTEEPASWVARHEAPEEQEAQPLAAYGGVISLIPNKAAVLQAMSVAGFTDVTVPAAREHHDSQYRLGDRVVALGR